MNHMNQNTQTSEPQEQSAAFDASTISGIDSQQF